MGNPGFLVSWYSWFIACLSFLRKQESTSCIIYPVSFSYLDTCLRRYDTREYGWYRRQKESGEDGERITDTVSSVVYPDACPPSPDTCRDATATDSELDRRR